MKCIQLISTFKYNTFLHRPNFDDHIENDYTNARLAGEFGGDCIALYNKCRYGDGLLDRISHFEIRK